MSVYFWGVLGRAGRWVVGRTTPIKAIQINHEQRNVCSKQRSSQSTLFHQLRRFLVPLPEPYIYIVPYTRYLVLACILVAMSLSRMRLSSLRRASSARDKYWRAKH